MQYKTDKNQKTYIQDMDGTIHTTQPIQATTTSYHSIDQSTVIQLHYIQIQFTNIQLQYYSQCSLKKKPYVLFKMSFGKFLIRSGKPFHNFTARKQNILLQVTSLVLDNT